MRDPEPSGAGGAARAPRTGPSPRKVSARLSDDLFVKLKVHAARRRLTTEQVVVEALGQLLSEE